MRKVNHQASMLIKGARCLNFGPSMHLRPFFVCSSSEGSGEIARMRRLAWAFVACIGGKY